MTFEQLYYFTEVYRQKSLGQAANNLYISRQSLSASIRKIEQELDTLLFTRSVGGITPTPAGIEFYHHAQDILEKYSILKQSMSSYSETHKPLDICKIAISESLISSYGNKLLDALSACFPQTYFDFSLYTVDKNLNSSCEFDISIAFLSEASALKKQQQNGSNDDYLFKVLDTVPTYIWISNKSPLNAYEVIPFEKLKNYPSCCLKNTYNSINFSNLIESLNNMRVVELERNFISNIEQFGYYTIDFPLNMKNLLYSDIFKGHNVSLKPCSLTFYLGVTYKKSTCEHFYPIIADVLTKNE